MIRASFSFGASPSRGSSCQTGSSFGLAVDRTQTENQRTPPPPRTKKALRQSKADVDRKSTRLNSSHVRISYAVFCLKKQNTTYIAVLSARSIRCQLHIHSPSTTS